MLFCQTEAVLEKRSDLTLLLKVAFFFLKKEKQKTMLC